MSVEGDVWPNAETQEAPETPVKGPSAADLRKTVDEANARAAAAEKRSALLEAGVDVSTPLGQMFAKAYDGDVEQEAIKTAWAALIPQAATTTTSADDPTPEELQMANARRSLSATGEPAAAIPDQDPYEAARKVYDQSLAQGHSKVNADASFVAELFKAANAGDRRVDPTRNRP